MALVAGQANLRSAILQSEARILTSGPFGSLVRTSTRSSL